jgi:hypothetical protein
MSHRVEKSKSYVIFFFFPSHFIIRVKPAVEEQPEDDDEEQEERDEVEEVEDIENCSEISGESEEAEDEKAEETEEIESKGKKILKYVMIVTRDICTNTCSKSSKTTYLEDLDPVLRFVLYVLL